MTKQVNFNVRLEADPTKLQERALVEKLYQAFKGSGTYLEMMFTQNWKNWMQLRITADFGCDLYEQAESWEKEAHEREMNFRGSVDDLESAKDELKGAREAQDVMETDIQHLQDELRISRKACAKAVRLADERKDVILEISKEKELLVERLEELKTPYHTRLEDLEHDVEMLKNPPSEDY